MSPPTAQPWRRDRAGIRLLVRVTPKSTREGVDGLMATPQGTALAVRVRAVADKGEANRAVEAVVAEWLGVPKSAVEVGAGGKSRVKTLIIAGDQAALEARLATRTGLR